MRYREDTPGELARARAAVAAWRDQNPAGTAQELTAALRNDSHDRRLCPDELFGKHCGQPDNSQD